MPLGFGRSILSKPVVAAAPVGNKFTSDADTLALYYFENSGTDESGNTSALTTSNGATYSTTQALTGTYSGQCIGSSPRPKFVIPNPSWTFTGDFTVECYAWSADWTNAPAGNNDRTIFEMRAAGTPTNGIFLYTNDAPGWYFYHNNQVRLSSGSPATYRPANSTWTHIALVRSSGTLSFYLNGTSIASTTYTATLNASNDLSFGSEVDNVRHFNGYFDEYRVSDVARYTGNFTPA